MNTSISYSFLVFERDTQLISFLASPSQGTSISLPSSPNPKLNAPPPQFSPSPSPSPSTGPLTTSSHFLFLPSFSLSSSLNASSTKSGSTPLNLSINNPNGSSTPSRNPETCSFFPLKNPRTSTRCLRGTKFCVMAITARSPRPERPPRPPSSPSSPPCPSSSSKLTTKCHHPDGTCNTSPALQTPSTHPCILRAAPWKPTNHSAMLSGDVTSL
ncbi:ctr copper transporter [Histoplasma capsulatum var. duboisii H88]|uniref:Ctr copper transporter n=1 Tax=Ajellomyces capsulatus (strain H88) TaxID=544711 RepID=A0A8A1LQL7_AJEC8|nr:ctr copper transporter [Histoplasma capsulatum var. duboisii H88]